jgi:hypothetical protein
MKSKSLMIAVAAALVGAFGCSLGGMASAATVVTVDATTPYGSWLDTGLDLSPGTTYDFTVIDPSTIWSAGSNSPYSRESNANGIPPGVGYGQWTMAGETFNYGALVGDAGGDLFLIGTGTILSGFSGELTVGYWDSYYPDNSGVQTLSISAVPEPATWAMMLFGVGLIGAGLRVVRQKGGRAPIAA